MSFFGRRRASLWTPPAGLDTRPRRVRRSVPFVYNSSEQPAFTLDQLDLSKSNAMELDLSKGYEAAQDALAAAKLLGLRAQIIFLVDGSGSMHGDYRSGRVQRMLIRLLGFSLNTDADGEIPVIVYGYGVSKPVTITRQNFHRADQLIKPDFGSTNMSAAFATAKQLVRQSDMLTIVFNLTDGGPDNETETKAEIIDLSEDAALVKNFAVRTVRFLEDVDDLPSRYEYEKNPDGSAKRDNSGNLVTFENPQGIRVFDNVDSQEIDPVNATDDEFATKLATELGEGIEMMGLCGHLTGVPGITRIY